MHPMAGAWVGDDPTMRGKAKVDLQPDHLVARWPKQRGMVEVFVLPNPEDLPETLDVEVRVGKRVETHTITLVERDRPQPGQADTLLTARLGGRTLTMTSAFAPIPSDLDSAIEGFDAEAQVTSRASDTSTKAKQIPSRTIFLATMRSP